MLEREADSVREREADNVQQRDKGRERERRETETVERENQIERETGNLRVKNKFQLIFLP